MSNVDTIDVNFDENMEVPHPYKEGEKITLKFLKEIQNELKKKMDLKHTILANDIKYVAGVDIGHHKTDENRAKVVISIFEYQSMKEVYRTAEEVKLTFPFISGFLGFREVEHFKLLLNKVKTTVPHYYPDLIMVDGNGLLHYHQFGSACHLGVELDIPTLGVGKTLYCIDGLDWRTFKGIKKPQGDYSDLTGTSGMIWGRALWNTKKASNAIFISQGNYINLDEAVKVIMKCSLHRIPEPIRQADLMSKVFD